MSGYDYTRDFDRVPRRLSTALLRDSAAMQVYFAILHRVRWEGGAESRGRHGLVQLQPGEAVIGRDEIGLLTARTPGEVRGAIRRLETLGAIATRATKLGTIVTLLGYVEISESQPVDSPTGQPAVRHPFASSSANGSPADPTELDRQLATNSDPDPDPDQKAVGSRPPSRRYEQAAAIATAAVGVINRIAGTSYRADSKDTLAKARALAKENLSPEDVVRAVEHVAKAWLGTEYPIRPSTLLQLQRVRTTLEDLQARRTPPHVSPAAMAMELTIGGRTINVLDDEAGRAG